MRQILIEKYIEPSELENFYEYVIKYWFDKYGDKHSFMGQPAEVWFERGIVVNQWWYKKGFRHRDRGMPACIRYNNEKIYYQEWHKNGEFIKKVKSNETNFNRKIY
jgi:hypothetical protein